MSGAVGATVVEAQNGWLPDRQQLQGRGFRAGNLELHPSFAAEGGVDNNIFLQKDHQQTAGILRLTGRLTASTLTNQRLAENGGQGTVPRKLTFTGGLGVSYYHYFTSALNDNAGADANFDLRIRPDARIGFRLYDRFVRQIRPFVDQPTPGVTAPSYGMNQNGVGADLLARSRGGVLRAQAGYEFGFVLFDSNLFTANNYLDHNVHVNAQWAFLPHTSLFQSTSVDFQNYTNASRSTENQLSNSTRVNSQIGINGSLTQKLSFTASGGYAGGFYKLQDDYSGGTWRAELRYRPIQTVQTSLGYDRTFNQSWIGGWMRSDMLTAGASALFRGVFLMQLRASLAFNQTGRAFVTGTSMPIGNSDQRKDTRLGLDLSLEYRATRWLSITGTVSYIASFTGYNYVVSLPGTIIPDPGSGYQRVDAWIGLRVFY